MREREKVRILELGRCRKFEGERVKDENGKKGHTERDEHRKR